MALTNKDVAPEVAPKPKKKGNDSGNDQLVSMGEAIVAGKSEDERALLGSKSSTLHFVNLLGLKSKKANRATAGRQQVDSFKPVGVILVSDEAISVPQIDITKDNETGIDPATDITYKNVAAGEEFNLSYYEFMYLIIRDEYAGMFTRGDNPQGAYLSVKMNTYTEGKTKLPTPTICFKGAGSPKESMIAIDEQDADGKWHVKPEYAEKYGALLKRKTPTRTSGSKNKPLRPIVISQALKKILGTV